MDHGKNDDQRFYSVDDNSRAKYIDNKNIFNNVNSFIIYGKI